MVIQLWTSARCRYLPKEPKEKSAPFRYLPWSESGRTDDDSRKMEMEQLILLTRRRETKNPPKPSGHHARLLFLRRRRGHPLSSRRSVSFLTQTNTSPVRIVGDRKSAKSDSTPFLRYRPYGLVNPSSPDNTYTGTSLRYPLLPTWTPPTTAQELSARIECVVHRTIHRRLA